MGYLQVRDEYGRVQAFHEPDIAPPIDPERLAQIRRFIGVLDQSADYRGQMLVDLLREVDRCHAS